MKLTDAERARVAEIKALHAAATPGVWYAVDKGNTVPSHAVMRYATGEKAVNIASGISPKTGNAEFIVNAHGAIPWLISIIDRLSQEPDGPDVVFCEDCVRFKDGECNSAYGLPDPVDETDYCSYGERRKERDDGGVD